MKKLFLLLMLLFPAFLASGQTSVLTQHNDNGRTGQNLSETVLTPSNVTASMFGKLFSLPVDGYVYAQPLYMLNVSIAGGTHNVVFVATEGDSVYAFDADNGAQLWHVSVIDTAHGATAGETTVSISELQAALGDPNCTDTKPQIGITSTPVIDPNTGTIYVEAKSEKTNGTMVHRLHMLSIATGAEKSPGPVVITATVPGTSDGGTTITFNAAFQLNRPGLLLSSGTVYLAYGSHCDDGASSTPNNWHGWMFAYNESTLARTAVFISTPNGVGEAGIWMSGAGIAADSSGNIFTATGNGNYDATDVGDSILKLNGSTLTLSDYFTPFDQGNDQLNDLDVASGGVLLLPTQPGNNPDELIQGTKGGTIYLIDRDQMTSNGKHFCNGCTSDPEIIQEILNAGNVDWLWATPAYFNNTVYFWGSNDVLKAYTLTNGLLGKSPSSSSTIALPFPGATPSISANGSTNGIVWAIDSSRSTTQAAVLHAFDPVNVAKEYYNTTQMGSRDQAGNAVKFTIPTIANGKVYIGTQTEVDVYGLLGSSSSGAATPSISPSAGTYAPPLTVTLTDSTAGATITYTTDGSNPVPGSNGTAVKSGATFQLTSSATVKAIGSASGLSNSGIATTAYTVQSSSGGGSPNYGSGFTASGLTLNGNSIGPATINGTRLRLTDGGDLEATSAFFNTPVNIQSFTNNFSFQLTSAVADGFIFCIQGNGPTALGQNGAKLGYGLDKNGANGIGNSVAVKFDIYNNDGEGTDSTGLFTDGARPTIPAVDMTASGVKLSSGDVMNVHMTYDGTTLTWTVTDATTGASFTTSTVVNIPSLVGGNTAYVGFTASTEPAAAAIQDILTWTLVSGGSSTSAAATPAISPGAGTYAPPLTVTLTDSTAGATITYTTDGSNPVPGSNGTAVKSGATFQLTSSATVKAIASASGLSNSGIATTAYTVQSSSGGGSPNYGSGFTASGLTLNGNGVVNATINGTRLRLTDGGDNEATSAFFNTPVNIQSFTNNFSFQLTSAVADGIIFCIQGDGPTALGQDGAKLGYGFGKAGSSGIGNSVAVKFDIYNNDGEGTDSTGLFTDGARPTIPAVDMTASGVTLTSGDVMNVHMTYDGTTLTWTITDATTGASFTTSTVVNIPSLVGGNTAYVGFTASTEPAAAAIQDILTWTLVSGGSSTSAAATPAISPGAGTYAPPLTVTLTDSTAGATITYTTDGSNPVPGSNGTAVKSGATFQLTSSATVKASASASGLSNSGIATTAYTVQSSSGGGSPNYGSGFTASGLTLNGNGVVNATINGTRLRLTDGGDNEATSAFFNTPVNIQSFTNNFSFQLTSAVADGIIFCIQGDGPTALGQDGAKLGYGFGKAGSSGIGNSVAVKFDIYNNDGEGTDSTGLFTDGARPTIPAVDMTASGVTLTSGDVMNVHMTYDGTTLTWTITDATTGASFTTSTVVNIPSLVGGNTAYVGFTASTEPAAAAIQDILTWTYTN